MLPPAAGPYVFYFCVNGNPSKSLFPFRSFSWYKRQRLLHLHHTFFLTLHCLSRRPLDVVSLFFFFLTNKASKQFGSFWKGLCLCFCSLPLFQIMQHKIKLPKCNTTPANVTRWGVFWSRLRFPPQAPFLPQPQSPSPPGLLLPLAGSSDIDKSF